MATEGVKQVIQSIYDEHGLVKPSMLVEAAKPKDSPAHDAFEWSDRKAGHQWRILQARNYIRQVEVVYDEQPTRLVHVPAITRSEGEYKPAKVVVSVPDEFERALDEAVSKLNAARRAVDVLREAAEKQPHGDHRSAMVAQISRGLEIMQEALDMRH